MLRPSNSIDQSRRSCDGGRGLYCRPAIRLVAAPRSLQCLPMARPTQQSERLQAGRCQGRMHVRGGHQSCAEPRSWRWAAEAAWAFPAAAAAHLQLGKRNGAGLAAFAIARIADRPSLARVKTAPRRSQPAIRQISLTSLGSLQSLERPTLPPTTHAPQELALRRGPFPCPPSPGWTACGSTPHTLAAWSRRRASSPRLWTRPSGGCST